METPDSAGTLAAYAVIWAFVVLCVILVVRWTFLFVTVVALGLAEKYDRLPAPVRRWLLARAAARNDPAPRDG